MYLSLGITSSFLFATVSALFWCEFFETPIILLAILLPIKSPVDSAVVWIALSEAVCKFIFANKNTKEIQERTKVKNTIRFWLKNAKLVYNYCQCWKDWNHI